jgi:hypothetical protein
VGSLIWDYQDVPDAEEILDALSEIGPPVSMNYVETGDDNHVIVMADEPMNGDEAQEWWEEHVREYLEDRDPDAGPRPVIQIRSCMVH